MCTIPYVRAHTSSWECGRSRDDSPSLDGCFIHSRNAVSSIVELFGASQTTSHRDDRLALLTQLVAKMLEFHVEMRSAAVFTDVGPREIEFAEGGSALDTSLDTAISSLKPLLHDEFAVVPYEKEAANGRHICIYVWQVLHQGPLRRESQ